MSWGHAVSRDLVHWENLPVALPEENGVMIFSGSAVVDWHNTSGLCKNPNAKDHSCLIAIYTGHTASRQTQNIAYSNDRGRTWTKYGKNPVIDLQMKDFRDPKVLWHEPTKKWIMVAALPTEKKVRFFSSANLLQWQALSDFGPAGATEGIWECPDLFPLSVDNNPKDTHWVLIVNLNPGSIAGGSGGQYFIGQFDGTTFKNENPPSQKFWLDYGKDFYATVSFFNGPPRDWRRIWLGWFSNWQYANQEPTSTFRGTFSVPRTVTLKRTPEGIRLFQKPVQELQTLRQKMLTLKDTSINGANQKLVGLHGDCLEVQAVFLPPNAGKFGIKVRKSAAEETVIGIDVNQQELFIDRARSGNTAFSKHFPGKHTAPLSINGPVVLRILIDRSSVEIFANNGAVSISDRIFPSPGSDEIELFSEGGDAKLRALAIWKMKSIWH